MHATSYASILCFIFKTKTFFSKIISGPLKSQYGFKFLRGIRPSTQFLTVIPSSKAVFNDDLNIFSNFTLAKI